jgi:hypothetical protein
MMSLCRLPAIVFESSGCVIRYETVSATEFSSFSGNKIPLVPLVITSAMPSIFVPANGLPCSPHLQHEARKRIPHRSENAHVSGFKVFSQDESAAE